MAITYHSGRRIQGTSTESNAYKVHTFTTGTTNFVMTGSGNVDVLVVAGGGAGSTDSYGGGGAGGMSVKSNHAVTAGTYSVVVGAGGNGGTFAVKQGTDGADSSFDSIISDGGGAGGINGGSGGTYNGGGHDGGSGGGIGTTTAGATFGDSTQGDTNGATGYGNSGGSGNQSGGGGAGSAAVARVGGAGRDNSFQTGNAITYAGGGGGQSGYAGGSGGGGASGSNGSNGTDGLGGGGGAGGATPSNYAGDGGDGVVIIRYLASSSISSTSGTVTNITATTDTVKPTNVQAGSRWEETDTRKMYHYAEAPTPSFEDDFANATKWTQKPDSNPNADWEITGGDMNISIIRDNNPSASTRNNNFTHDLAVELGSGNTASDTWVWRFKFTLEALTNNANNYGYTGGLAICDLTASTNNNTTGGYGISFTTQTGNNNSPVRAGSTGKEYGLTNFANQKVYHFDEYSIMDTAASVNQVFYVEIIRNSLTLVTCNLYTDSTYETLSGTSNTITLDASFGNRSLRYIRAYTGGDDGLGGNVLKYKIDDMKFYDGVTVAATGNAWEEEGT